MPEYMPEYRKDSNWIWSPCWKPEDKDCPRVMLFRKAVRLEEEPRKGHLDISADTRYKLYVNGRLVETGPSRGDHQVWFYDMTADGFSLDDKRSSVADNDIPDIIERFKNLNKEADRKRTDKSFMVPKQDIVDNDYDLSINKYKEVEYVAVEYPPTFEIMADIREIEMEIGKEMDELEKLLNL